MTIVKNLGLSEFVRLCKDKEYAELTAKEIVMRSDIAVLLMEYLYIKNDSQTSLNEAYVRLW